jgi:hypothetical protein
MSKILDWLHQNVNYSTNSDGLNTCQNESSSVAQDKNYQMNGLEHLRILSQCNFETPTIVRHIYRIYCKNIHWEDG